MCSIQFPDLSAGMLTPLVSESVMNFQMRSLQVLKLFQLTENNYLFMP